jgi:hypothetical protein
MVVDFTHGFPYKLGVDVKADGEDVVHHAQGGKDSVDVLAKEGYYIKVVLHIFVGVPEGVFDVLFICLWPPLGFPHLRIVKLKALPQ